MLNRYLFLSLVLASSALVGDEFYSEPAFTEEQGRYFGEEQSRFDVRAEYLLFQTTWDQPSYVINARDNFNAGEHYPVGKRHVNNPAFESGLRVEALYAFEESPHDLDLRFTWLQSDRTNQLTGPVLWDVKGFPGDGAQSGEDAPYNGFAQDRLSFHYYGADLTFNRFTPGCFGENLNFLVGLHFAYVKFEEHFLSVGTTVEATEAGTPVNNNLFHKSRFWGIGPEFGVNYTYDFYTLNFCNVCGELAFVANARASLLASSTKPYFKDVTARTGSAGVSLSNETIWRVTPTLNTRLGISYDFAYSYFKGALEIGYEFLWYHNAIDTIVGTDVAFAGDTLDIYSNLNSHGLYVALTFGF